MATPPVGADIESICGKCGDVWHVVVAKVGDKVAKVLCKQCGAQHRHKPPERPGDVAAAAAGKPAKVKKARATGTKKKSSGKTASATEPMVSFDPDKPAKPYKASELFSVGDRVSHPSFGTGVVELSPGPGKMQVFFPDGGRRVLACAKAASTIGPVPTRKDDGGKPPQGL